MDKIKAYLFEFTLLMFMNVILTESNKRLLKQWVLIKKIILTEIKCNFRCKGKHQTGMSETA